MDTNERLAWNETRYEDVLRTVGHLLDTEGWREIRLVETKSGLQIAARSGSEPESKHVAFALGGPQLEAMLRAGHARRGSGRASALLAAADAASDLAPRQ